MKTLKEFHQFFSEIPHEKWTSGVFCQEDSSIRDALGHTFEESSDGLVPSQDSYDLLEQVSKMKFTLVEINDKPQQGYPQARPKARVLSYLENAMRLK